MTGILAHIFIGIAKEEYGQPIVYAREVVEESIYPREVRIGVKIDWTPERIKNEYQDAATRYGLSENEFQTMWAVISKCENRQLNPHLQSQHLYDFSDPSRGIYAGTQELSFGISQIHLPDHPNVSEKEAKDPAFSADFTAKNWRKHKTWWTCYKLLN